MKKCPACGWENQDQELCCTGCGIVFAKWEERHQPSPSASADRSASASADRSASASADRSASASADRSASPSASADRSASASASADRSASASASVPSGTTADKTADKACPAPAQPAPVVLPIQQKTGSAPDKTPVYPSSVDEPRKPAVPPISKTADLSRVADSLNIPPVSTKAPAVDPAAGKIPQAHSSETFAPTKSISDIAPSGGNAIRKSSEGSGVNPFIIVVVVLLLAGAGFWYWYQSKGRGVNEVISLVNGYFAAISSLDAEKLSGMTSEKANSELKEKGGMTPEMLEMVKAMQPAAIKITKVTIDEDTATVLAVPDDSNFNSGAGQGEIKIIRENGAWKVEKIDWTFNLNAMAYIPGGGITLHGMMPVASFPAVKPEFLAGGMFAYTGAAQEFFSGPTPEKIYEAQFDEIPSVVFSADGSRLLCFLYGNYTYIMLDGFGFSEIKRTTMPNRPVSAAASPDGTFFAVGDAYGGITIIPVAGGQDRTISPGGTQALVAISPNSRLIASVGWQKNFILIDSDTGVVVSRKDKSMPRMSCVAFMPQAPYIAAGNAERSFNIWDLTTGKGKKYGISKVMKDSAVAAIAFSPDGKKFATAHSDSSIVVFETETQKEIANYFVTDAGTMDIEFSPDGKILATAHANGNIYLWNGENATRLSMIKAHTGQCTNIAFSPDGTKLASGGEDKFLRIWGR